MANIECKDCGDLVDVEARTVTLPFVCKWCKESLRNNPKYRGYPKRYIIQYKGCDYKGCDGWIRSENTDARGVFDDFSVASAVAAAETDNGDGLVYRVVPYGTPDEYSETASESDEVCHCIICEPEVEPEPEPESETETETESEGLEDQFELDTKLIEDLNNQLAFKDSRIHGLTFGLEVRDKTIAARDVKIKSLENSLDYYIKIYNRLYKDFSELERLYFLERRKTWWERLWS